MLKHLMLPSNVRGSNSLDSRWREVGKRLPVLGLDTIPPSIRKAPSSISDFEEELEVALAYSSPASQAAVVRERLELALLGFPCCQRLFEKVAVADRISSLQLLYSALGIKTDPTNLAAPAQAEKALSEIEHVIPTSVSDFGATVHKIRDAVHSKRQLTQVSSRQGPSDGQGSSSMALGGHALSVQVADPKFDQLERSLNACKTGDHVTAISLIYEFGSPLGISVLLGKQQYAVSSRRVFVTIAAHTPYQADYLEYVFTTNLDDDGSPERMSGYRHFRPNRELVKQWAKGTLVMSTIVHWMGAFLVGVLGHQSSDYSIKDYLTLPSLSPIFEDRFVRLLNGYGIGSEGASQFFIMTRSLLTLVNPMMPTATVDEAIIAAFTRSMEQLGTEYRAALAGPTASLPHFDPKDAEEAFTTLQGACEQNQQLMRNNPALGNALVAFSAQLGAGGGGTPTVPAKRTRDGKEKEPKKSSSAWPTDAALGLTLAPGCRYVKTLKDGTLVWRTTNGGKQAWSPDIALEWKKLTGYAGDPLWDVLLSGKKTREQRVGLAVKGAVEASFAEPADWTQIRDRFLLPNFALPVGN